MEELKDHLPVKPERPLDSECCGLGCDPCIMDIYQEELTIWERECDRIKRGIAPSDAVSSQTTSQISFPVLSSSEYNGFTIDEITEETHDCKRYKFSLQPGHSLGLKAGQHVIIRADNGGEVVTRQYTPVSDIHRKNSFELLIKVYQDGKMSMFVRQWKQGTSVQMRGPCGTFHYVPNKHERLVMFAVGTGIAPMAQIIQAVLNNAEDETRVHLHLGCRTYQEIPLKSWLDDWAQYWNFQVTYYLSQEANDGSKQYRYGDTIVQSRISRAAFECVINQHGGTGSYLMLICGTKSFEKDTAEWLSDLNIPSERYHKF